jgi:endoglucanase
MKQLIQRLTEVTGPSGYEQNVRDVVRAEIEGLADDVRVDALGNLIARKGTKAEGGLRIMVSAHMDEIGVIVTHIDEHGFARFSNIGGVYPVHCVGARVAFLNGTRGLIYMDPAEPANQLPALQSLYIDTGALDKASSPVKVGDLGVFERPFLDLGKRVVS